MITENQQLLEQATEKEMSEIYIITDEDEHFGYDYWLNLQSHLSKQV